MPQVLVVQAWLATAPPAFWLDCEEKSEIFLWMSSLSHCGQRTWSTAEERRTSSSNE
jgi:hypothetical protein